MDAFSDKKRRADSKHQQGNADVRLQYSSAEKPTKRQKRFAPSADAVEVVDLITPRKDVEHDEIISLLDSSDDEDERKVDCKLAARRASDHDRNLTKRTTDNEKNIEEDAPVYLTTTQVARAEPTMLPLATTARMSPFSSIARSFLDSVDGDLTYEKKREIFDDGRRPEQLLQVELNHLYSQLKVIPNRQSDEWNICTSEIDRVKEQLNTSRQNAAQDIYNRNNSAGGMGIMNEEGKLCVDFHGLYVRDAIAKFDEMVLPVLPVQREVAIITGKGNHSKNGSRSLRNALVTYIEQTNEFRTNQIRHKIDSRNEGRLCIRWVSNSDKT